MVTVKKELVVKNKLGLHARPAAMFVQIANKFTCEITVIKDNVEVNGKSIIGILMLAAEKDSAITIVASGSDAKEAFLELEKIVSVEEMEHPKRQDSQRLALKSNVKHSEKK
jgi:phosphotransferase system HPr (HPr) family protein